MWEDRESRKYTVPGIPGSGLSGNGPVAAYNNRGFVNTEDLHAWSIFRQNLNADLSEFAIGVNKSSNTERPFGNFQLRETTVKNILNHPKYGPRLRDQDPASYLRYGLPRVKVTQSELGGVATSKPNGAVSVLDGGSSRHLYDTNVTSDSASGSDEDENVKNYKQRRNVRRTWKSDPDLIRVQNEHNGAPNHYVKQSHGHASTPSKYASNSHIALNSTNPNAKASSEADLRFSGNHFQPTFRHKTNSSHYSDGLNPAINGAPPKHPHLIVRNLYYEIDRTSTFKRFCGAQRTKLRVLNNISFEVRAGEILAIMATNELEGTAALEILANKYNKRNSMIKGDIILNGIFMSPQKLGQIATYVSQDCSLCPDMSTRQTLFFSSLLQGPAKKNAFDTKKRTNAVLEELGLSEVRHTRVADLNEAEKRRLQIAISLLLDTDILLLDQPTKGMDIFDTFFLIEYLRQWALISGRCVILTIQPPTYEIFTMISRIALISTGRILYFGKRRDLLSYFSYIDFPCPAFKNPSDYYLDLVTLDNLSSEAMLESSQRIENLVDMYAQRCSNSVSLPGPPSITPSPVRKSSFPIKFLALWIRALIFTFPYNVIHLFKMVFFSLCLSIVTGIIYWHVRVGREQEHIWDRVGLYHTILAIMPIPLFLTEMNDVHKEKDYVLNEIKMGLYTKSSYLCSKLLYSLPKAAIVFIFYSLPISSMAGLQNNILIYLILMLAYLLTIRMIAIAMSWLFDRRSTAAIGFALIFTIFALSSGTTFHINDLSLATRWLHSASPLRYAHESLIGLEFNSNSSSGYASGSSYLCTHNPIVQQENAILIRADCGFLYPENVLKWFNYKGSKSKEPLRSIYHPFISFAIVFTIFFIIAIFSFCTIAKRKAKYRNQLGFSIK